MNEDDEHDGPSEAELLAYENDQIAELQRQLQAVEARMTSLMDEKTALQQYVKQLERQVRLKLKPNTRERINGRPF